MPLQTKASTTVYRLLAELIESGEVPPAENGGVSVSGASPEHNFQVTVIITPYQPWKVNPEKIERFIEKVTAESAATEVVTPVVPPKLTPLMKQIVAVLSPVKPLKAEVIAMRLNKNCGGSFRSLLADLVRFGIAKHVHRSGYMLANVRSQPDSAA
jgi:hypothetical protein